MPRILYVDDDPDLLGLMQTRLAVHGFEVTCVQDGEAALEKVKGDPPDLVLIDLGIPRVSGLEVCARLKQDPATRQIPIVVISGSEPDRHEAQCRRIGVEDYFVKTQRLELLLEKIRALMEKGTPAQAPRQTHHTLKLTRPLVVLDLETTGTWVEKDRIVEIALLRCLPSGRCDLYTSRVNPGVPIPPRVSRIIGITDADVKEAPPFKAIAPQVMAFIGEADLGGFNVERFDLLILERELYQAGHKFDWRRRTIYDAQKVYHLNERRDLKAAYQFYCGKALRNRHTAQGDAEATLEILDAQVHRYGKPPQGLESLRDFEYQRMDDFFDAERKFRWWAGELYPTFGKYGKRKSLKEILQIERSYLEWLLGQDFPKETREMLRGVLEGRFPTPPA